MITKVAPWGNSLAVRIPRDAARQLDINGDDRVELVVVQEGLLIRPLRKDRAFDLDDLIAGITADNVHDEVATGAALGNEL